MRRTLELWLGVACLLIILGSGVLMTIYTLQVDATQISQDEWQSLHTTVEQLVSVVTTKSAASSIVKPTSNQSTVRTERLAINQATLTELDQLPGIGEVRAQAIVDARTHGGPFIDLDDLHARVPKIPLSVLQDIEQEISF